jgi:hypothetical protein
MYINIMVHSSDPIQQPETFSFRETKPKLLKGGSATVLVENLHFLILWFLENEVFKHIKVMGPIIGASNKTRKVPGPT